MKTLLFILLISMSVTAQKVIILDLKDNPVSPVLEKINVPDALEHLPNGLYKMVDIKATKRKDGRMLFKTCLYLKTSLNEIV